MSHPHVLGLPISDLNPVAFGQVCVCYRRGLMALKGTELMGFWLHTLSTGSWLVPDAELRVKSASRVGTTHTWPKAGVGTRGSEREDCTQRRGQSSA